MKKINVIFPEKIGTIAPEIYGHFSEHIGGVIYGGIWVGKNSKIPNINGWRKEFIEKFKKINPSVLRWPGGCFAEAYHWRDGIGENRPIRLTLLFIKGEVIYSLRCFSVSKGLLNINNFERGCSK